jgi:hypothetical protein
MHHWTAFTCLALTNNSTLIALWRDVVPTIAFRHSWLLQAIFAVTAQHNIHELKLPDPALVETATRYHHEALTAYIQQLNDINESNCEALFCFSQLIVGLSYSRLILSQDSVIRGMIDIMVLLKGTLAVAEQGSKWLNSGVLQPMMTNYPELVPVETSRESSACTTALKALSEHIARDAEESCGVLIRQEILESTIQLVHALLISDSNPEDRLNKIIGLPVFVDKRFAALLKAGDQAALVVLAFYGVALSKIDGAWFFEGVGPAVVYAVAAVVVEEWAGHLSWPLLQMEEQR